MMRNRIFISLLAALSLTACIRDNYRPEYCSEEDNTFFMSFVLESASGPLMKENTKATIPSEEFSAQTVAEQLVSRVDLFFYDESGNYLGKSTRTSFEQTPQDDPVSNVVGKFVVKLDFKPKRMLVTVNSRSASMALTGKTLSQALDEIQEKSTEYCGSLTEVIYKKGGANESLYVTPFYMSSSTYKKDGKIVCDVEIPEGYVHTTELAARKSSPVEVYLERMAAKVTLIVPKLDLDYMVPIITSQDSVTAKLTLVGWNVNAINRSSYYFKKASASWDYSWQVDPNDATKVVSWNNEARFRSYWGEDPNYIEGAHGVDIPKVQPSSDTEEFLYRKPTEFLTFTKDTGKNVYTGYTYCLENTMEAGVLPVKDTDDKTLYSRATHILIKAKLSFAFDKYESDPSYDYKDDDEFKGAQDFFRYKGMFFTKKGLLKALRRDTNNDADPTSSPLYDIDDSDLQLVSAASLSYCKGYDKGERVAVQRSGDSSYPDLKDASGNPVRIDGFKEGYFYYKIPIEHINNEDFTGTTYPIAKYGVVRNHSYEITLAEDLKGIGTGIWDDSFDIRPFRKTDDYRVTAYVRVSPWMQFETRFLFIDPSGLLVTDGQRVDRWEDGDNPHGNDWTGDGWYF